MLEENPKKQETLSQNRSSTQVQVETVGKILSLSEGLKKIRSDLSIESDFAIKRLYESGERLPAFLFYGETGSGKGAIATWFRHNLKTKARKVFPYGLVNCAAVQSSLLVPELFGIEEGVASDVGKRPGKIASAKNGFLFLDEIDKAPQEFISALLTWMDRGEYNPVGNDEEPIEARAIIACAMVGEPYQKVNEGKWNSDFVFRFNDPIHIPPLRLNKDDIVPLARFFAERFLRRYLEDDSLEVEISRELADDLEQYSWPGNIRELETKMENAVKKALANQKARVKARLILTKKLFGEDLLQPNLIKTSLKQTTYLYTPPSSLHEYNNITKPDFERTVLGELRQRLKGKDRDATRKRINRLPQNPTS